MIVGIVVATVLGLLQFGKGEVARFERLAAAEILSNLGGDHAKVKVRAELNGILGGLTGDLKRASIDASAFTTPRLPFFTEPDRTKRGRVRTLELKFTDFELAGLRVKSLTALIPDCRYDIGLAMRKHHFRISKSGTGTGEVAIDYADLETYLARKYREFKTVHISRRLDALVIEGDGVFVMAEARYRLITTLRVEGSAIYMGTSRLFLKDSLLDEEATAAVLKSFSPLVDLDRDLKLYGAVSLNKIVLGDEGLVALGAVKLPDRPKSIPELGKAPVAEARSALLSLGL